MIQADVPAWLAFVVVGLALAGSTLSLLGAVGLTRLKTFYERVHAPTLGARTMDDAPRRQAHGADQHQLGQTQAPGQHRRRHSKISISRRS